MTAAIYYCCYCFCFQFYCCIIIKVNFNLKIHSVQISSRVDSFIRPVATAQKWTLLYYVYCVCVFVYLPSILIYSLLFEHVQFTRVIWKFENRTQKHLKLHFKTSVLDRKICLFRIHNTQEKLPHDLTK